jgi:ABC-type branched-subunit amino acid transport system ATPase component
MRLIRHMHMRFSVSARRATSAPEQNIAFAAGLADTAHVIEKRMLRHSGPLAALSADEQLRAEYLAL